MGIKDKDISVKNTRRMPSASELFTDRVDPQEAFERKLKLIEAYRTKASAVLCYYGIGGIGKTSLMNKLIRLVEHRDGVQPVYADEINGYCATIDFGAEGMEQDKLEILKRIRNQLLSKEPKLKFILFDTALLYYYKRCGLDNEIVEKETSLIVEKNPWIKATVNVLGVVPVIGWSSNVIQALDVFVAALKDKNEKNNELYRDKIREMNGLEPSEIIQRIHEYFAADMCINVKSYADKPFVLFLDTYEQFVDSMNNDALRLDSDHWLRKGPRSLMQSIPGILWMVFGREKLDWREDDPYWEEENDPVIPLCDLSDDDKENLANNLLEQHLLGDLIYEDALSYLCKTGITDENLCKGLYELTKGTPLYLDICVRHYYELLDAGHAPTVADFGKDLTELVNRYLKNMPSHYRRMLCVMSVLDVWDDEKFTYVVEKLPHSEWYSKTRYEDLLRHSLIIKDEKGNCYVHATVKEACQKIVDTNLLHDVHKASLAYGMECAKLAEDGGMDELIYDSVYVGNPYANAIAVWGIIKERIYANERTSRYDLNLSLLSSLFKSVQECYPQSDYEYVVSVYLAYWLSKNGNLKDAELLLNMISESDEDDDFERKDVWEANIFKASAYDMIGKLLETSRILEKTALQLKRFGENDLTYIRCLEERAKNKYHLRYYEEALELKKLVYNKRKEILGEDHLETIRALHTLAMSYGSCGDYEKEMELAQQVYIKWLEIFGEDNLATIKSLSLVGAAYNNLGDEKKALEIKQQVYEKFKVILGEKHPDTIKALSSIGTIYSNLGDKQKALEIREQVCNLQKEILGEEHPDTITTMQYLRDAYWDCGELQKALDLQFRIYEWAVANCGKHSDGARKCLSILGALYRDLGEYHEALRRDLDAYEAGSGYWPEESAPTLRCRYWIAFDYEKLGDYDWAISIIQEVYEQQLVSLGENQPDTRDSYELMQVIREKMKEEEGGD